MSNYIVVDDATHIIVNRVIWDGTEPWAPPAGHTAVAETGAPMAIGGNYQAGVYTPPPPIIPSPPLVVIGVSSRQFWMQMAVGNFIGEDEAVKALGGDLPHGLKQFIQTLPVRQRFVARMFFDAPTFEPRSRVRNDLKAWLSLTDAAIDQFFHDAGTL